MSITIGYANRKVKGVVFLYAGNHRKTRGNLQPKSGNIATPVKIGKAKIMTPDEYFESVPSYDMAMFIAKE